MKKAMTWTNSKISTCPCFITSASNAVLNDLKEAGFKGLIKPSDWEKFGQFIDDGLREVIEVIREGQESQLSKYVKKKLFFKVKLDQRRLRDNPDALFEIKWQQYHMANNYKKNLAKKEKSAITYEDDAEELNLDESA